MSEGLLFFAVFVLLLVFVGGITSFHVRRRRRR
jgi:hypothetical protein